MSKTALSALMLFLRILPLHAQTLTILTEDDYPPSSMIVAGELTGSSVEVVKEIQRRVGDASEIEALPWARAYAMARSMPNVVLFATGRLPEREHLFHWIGPILQVEWAVFAMKGIHPKLSDLDEVKRLRAIGTYRDDAQEQYLKSKGFTNLESASNQIINAKKLAAGRLDAFVTKDIALTLVLKEAGIPPDTVENIFTFHKLDVYIAVSQGTPPEIVAAWTKAFAEMVADGTFKAIYAKWYPGRTPPR